MSSRVILIGDLHGVVDEIPDLLDACAYTSSDRVIFLGDLVDRGPSSSKAVDFVRLHGFESLLGNHEERHLGYWKDERKGKNKPIKNEDHARTRSQLTRGHYEYFMTLPKYIELPEHNVIAVHAGVVPDVPIGQQSDRILMHGQSIIAPTGPTPYWQAKTDTWWPSKAPPEAKFWAEFYTGPQRIVFGHTVVDKPLLTDLVAGIDTGCVFGMTLTALILPDWRTVSVPARKVYFESNKRAEFPLMNGVSCFS